MGESPFASLDKILAVVKPIFEEIDGLKEQLIEKTIEITQIKAPTFHEANRGNFICDLFKKYGYNTVIDEIGNVLASQNLDSMENPVILSAHLDTVFPEEVVIKVKRKSDILSGPGVGDNSRGLVVLLIIAKLFKKLKTKIPVLFVATVGEEGLGDLRGVKHLFEADEHAKIHPIRTFIAIDGTKSSRVVTGGIGSLRFRVHFNGPGGHSFGEFGICNPAYALADFMNNFSKIKVPTERKTTYSIGIINGGTSINTIPDHVWADIDLRSAHKDELMKLESKVKNLVEKSANLETTARRGEINYTIEKLGKRPSGKLAEDSFLLDAVKVSNNYFEIEHELVASSTDANVPLSLNVPAISVAGVENSGRAHTIDEWIDAGESSLLPIKRNLLLLALLVL